MLTALIFVLLVAAMIGLIIVGLKAIAIICAAVLIFLLAKEVCKLVTQ